MSELLKNTREKARMCRANGNDIAADEYDSYADHIEELEATAKGAAEYERQWNDLLAVSRQADKLNREMYPQFREQKDESHK